MFPNKRMGGMLQWGGYAKYNVYVEVKIDRDDERPWYVQGMVEVPVDAFDHQVPTCFVRTHYDRSAEPTEHLACRRVFKRIYTSAAHRLSKYPKKIDIEFVLQTLSARCIEEVRSFKHVQRPDVVKRSTRSALQPNNTKTYPYVSLCSGCGGDLSGARAAGATPTLAIDKHEPANITARMNFPSTAICYDDISNIASYSGFDCRICHMSLPCQPHSLAHTRPGPNDDANYLASLVVQQAIESMGCPDILTMENVQGLVVKGESRPWFVTIINSIAETGPGYSLRWRLFDFREYGTAPRRLRFVLFASR